MPGCSGKKIPVILQERPQQCGPVALQIICQYYGKDVELSELESLTKMTEEGTSLLSVSDAAEKLGFRTLAASVPYEKLRKEAPLPAILHWRNNHFLVLYKINKDSAWISDPASGLVSYETSEFIFNWRQSVIDSDTVGVVLLLEKTASF